MSAVSAKAVFVASALLLGTVGLSFANATKDPRSDLVGSPVANTVGNETSENLVEESQRKRLVRGASTPAVSVQWPEVRSKTTIVPTEPRPRPAPQPAKRSLTKPRPLPVRLSVPAIGVDSAVVSVGLEEDRSMEVPSAADAGWFRYGPKPGDAQGSAVLAGHVDHAKAPGVFLNLRRLKVGDEIVVTDASDERHRYVVTERFQMDKEDVPLAELFRRDGAPVLTLITCGGKFSKSDRSYSDNIVVRATPVR